MFVVCCCNALIKAVWTFAKFSLILLTKGFGRVTHRPLLDPKFGRFTGNKPLILDQKWDPKIDSFGSALRATLPCGCNLVKAFLFDLIRFVRVRKRSTYIAFDLYRVRVTVSKMKFEIAKVFDLDGVRLKSISGEMDPIFPPKAKFGIFLVFFSKNQNFRFRKF